MADDEFDITWKEGRDPRFAGGWPGYRPGHRTDTANGLRVEYDVPVELRDGTTIYIDLLRPDTDGEYPVLVSWAPYGKHHPESKHQDNLPGSGVSSADLSEYTVFESPDPAYFCGHGYAMIHADPRGAWGSAGDLTLMSEQEARDCYDLIEWAGTRDWSNGRVGMTGVSYLAWTQWRVAAMDPPHLAAINPQEGVSDFYREAAYHGGIPSTFMSTLMPSWSYSQNRVEDIERMTEEHPLFDDYWASKNADLSAIETPAYVVASWSDQGLHTRGTLEAFKQMQSTEKWLRVHGRKKWEDFYQDYERQRQFFDKFLKGIDSEVDHWPRVRLEIRERYYVGNERGEDDWPIPRTDYVPLYLDARDQSLREEPVEEAATVRYDVDDAPAETEQVQFQTIFDAATELTGYMKLKLWVEADGADDMDLFVTVDKVDRTGDRVPFATQTLYETGPVAFGWLRASHRELDEERSTPQQPVHSHTDERTLEPGEVVPVEIEIWPSSTAFAAGEGLRLTIAGSDIYPDPATEYYCHRPLVNAGDHVVHTGESYDSHLLVPVVPDR